MAPPIRTARLSMEAFPECPSEFRPTLEKLIALLNEQGNAIAQALNGNLTRAENMRGGYVTASGRADSNGQLRAQTRNPLDRAPSAVLGVRVERTDAANQALNWAVSSWRVAGDGVLEIHVVGLFASADYRITCIVE